MHRPAASVLVIAVALLVAMLLPATACGLDSSPPATTVKLVFVHHSTGQGWLSDGLLGSQLTAANYYVSDTNYGWGPDGIGNTTDVGHWWTWFRGPGAATYTSALYAATDNMSGYTRMPADPGGSNEVVMFKSCFPNSNVEGSASDAVPAIGANPLKGGSGPLTVGNVKGVYLDLLEYFKTRPDKLFVLVITPPLRSVDTNATNAANARYLADWLVDPNGWLKGYTAGNVVAFDYYNVLTGGYHTVSGDAIVHTAGPSNYLAYPTGDSHPSAVGHQRATANFVPWLNASYRAWKSGTTLTVTPTLPKAAVSRPTVSTSRIRTSTRFYLRGSVSPAHAERAAVKLEIYRKVGRSYRYWRSVTAYAAAGATGYSVRYRIPLRGSFAVRAVHADSDHSPSVSSFRYLTVR